MPHYVHPQNRLQMLHSPTNIYENITGGWSISERNTDYVSLSQSLTDSDINEITQKWISDNDYGSLCCIINHKFEDLIYHGMTVKSNNLISYKDNKFLQFAFTKIGNGIDDPKFAYSVYISLENASGDKVYRIWHSSGKLGIDMHGTLSLGELSKNTDVIKDGGFYIAIHINARLAPKRAALTTAEREHLITSDGTELTVVASGKYGEEAIIQTRYGEDIYTVDNEILMTAGEKIGDDIDEGETSYIGGCYFSISSMWLE